MTVASRVPVDAVIVVAHRSTGHLRAMGSAGQWWSWLSADKLIFATDDWGAMPFTPAHVAAVLPFARRPWVVPALVAGSMAPDMPYFARMLPVAVTAESWYEPLLNATASHSVINAVTVALPYALLLTVVWWVSRIPLISVFTVPMEDHPAANERRWLGPSGLGIRFAWLIASALVGIATHLGWDAATSSMRALQHVSTAVGLLVLLAVLVRHRVLLRRLRIRIVVVAVLFVGVAASAGALFQRRNDATSTIDHLLRAGAEAGGLAVGVAWVLLVAGWWLWQAFSLRVNHLEPWQPRS